jgi:hypothetical protein
MDSTSENNLPAVLAVLDRLTEEELAQLNHVVVERLRLMRQIRSHNTMMNFRIGQRVRFTTSAGEIIRGVISRYNRKSVTIVSEHRGQWRVSPEFIHPE